jgi:hypothetical protein
MQSHDLLELCALLLCARFTASCQRGFLAGFPVVHFENVNCALVEYFATIAKNALRCCKLASDLAYGIGFLFVVAK